MPSQVVFVLIRAACWFHANRSYQTHQEGRTSQQQVHASHQMARGSPCLGSSSCLVVSMVVAARSGCTGTVQFGGVSTHSSCRMVLWGITARIESLPEALLSRGVLSPHGSTGGTLWESQRQHWAWRGYRSPPRTEGHPRDAVVSLGVTPGILGSLSG